MEGAERLLSKPIDRLIPLLHPPFVTDPPDIPLPTRPLAFPTYAPFRDIVEFEPGKKWQTTTHIFPAAWPRHRHRSVQNRSSRFEPAYVTRPVANGKEAIEAEAEWAAAHNQKVGLIDLAAPESYRDQDQLWIAVNRYVRDRPRKREKPGYTLVLSHANGLHKETWEPLMAYLLETSVAPLIDEMWSLDLVCQGDSGLLNRHTLGDAIFWPDAARDLAAFLVQYLPAVGETLSSVPPPYILPLQPLSDPHLRNLDAHHSSPFASGAEASSGPQLWRGRQIIAIGHSVGGCCTGIVCSSLPMLVSGAILMDPICTPPSVPDQNRVPITAQALSRRDRWESREVAAINFAQKKAFFGRWDPPVLQRFIEYALADVPDGVELKGRKQHEALIFADPPSEVFGSARLPVIPRWLAQRTLFVHPEVGRSFYPENAVSEIVGSITGSSQMRIQGAGHLIVQEAPREAALVIARYLEGLSRASNL